MATMERAADQDEEALRYLRERNIPGLVEEMVEMLVRAKPEDPVAAVADFMASVDRVPYAVPATKLGRIHGGLGEHNLLLLSDSYKYSHYVQYPPKTTRVFSYFESRGGKYPKTVFFGLQILMKKHLQGVVVTPQKIAEAKKIISAHLPPSAPFNEAGWQYIWDKHGGRLPVVIKAVPEGTVVDTKNVLFTLENTDDNCFWLVNFLETLLVQVWYPMTVATHSRACKQKILDNLKETGDPGGIMFKLHDFGFRGVSSVETAGIGGAAHLVNFLGTDTVQSIITLRDYYGAEIDPEKTTPSGFPPCPGYSIPASEHSTITAWGRDGEVEAMGNMLTQYPTGLVACVSDSYDIYAACKDMWGSKLKAQVLGRDGTLVIRPDSGDVLEVSLKIHDMLYEAFGGTVNDKGYKVLDPHVRIIWGDGIDYESLGGILDNLKKHQWSGDNIAFGSGGGLLQKLHRDTQKCAFKCSYALVDGKPVEVFKQPITDPGKVSKKGKLSLHKVGDSWITKMGADYDEAGDQLVEVFRDGTILKEFALDDIRARASEGL